MENTFETVTFTFSLLFFPLHKFLDTYKKFENERRVDQFIGSRTRKRYHIEKVIQNDSESYSYTYRKYGKYRFYPSKTFQRSVPLIKLKFFVTFSLTAIALLFLPSLRHLPLSPPPRTWLRTTLAVCWSPRQTVSLIKGVGSAASPPPPSSMGVVSSWKKLTK